MAPSSECDVYVPSNVTLQYHGHEIIIHHYKWPDPVVFPIFIIGKRLNRAYTREDRWIQLTQRCR